MAGLVSMAFRAGDVQRLFGKMDDIMPAVIAGLDLAAIHFEGEWKSNSRVLTGRYRSSIAVRRDGDRKRVVGTNVNYAPFVGGSGMATGFVGAGDAFVDTLVTREKDNVLEIIRKEVRAAMEGT